MQEMLEGAFIFSRDYLYHGELVKRNRVTFSGIQISSGRGIKIMFDLSQIDRLHLYTPKPEI